MCTDNEELGLNGQSLQMDWDYNTHHAPSPPPPPAPLPLQLPTPPLWAGMIIIQIMGTKGKKKKNS